MTLYRPSGSAERALAAIAAASAAMVEPYDVVGTTTRLLQACVDATGATSAGLLVLAGGKQLQLLASTSHRAEHLEFYQLLRDEGPCVDSGRSGEVVVAPDICDVERRWPQLAASFRKAAFESAIAIPLRWHSEVIGALNLFWAGPHEHTEELIALSQAFADVATLAIVHSEQVSASQVIERTHDALEERTIIEQAKGVLAHQHNVSVDDAFTSLMELAGSRHELLSTVATAVVELAERGERLADSTL